MRLLPELLSLCPFAWPVLLVSYYPIGVFLIVLIIPDLLPQPLLGSASVGPWERRMRMCKLLVQR